MKKIKAFTLIELIVVVAIIGILATAVSLEVLNSEARARDSRRISDLSTVASAIRMYDNKNNYFPNNPLSKYCDFYSTTPNTSNDSNYSSSCLSDLMSGNYLDSSSSLPKDPSYDTTNNSGPSYSYEGFSTQTSPADYAILHANFEAEDGSDVGGYTGSSGDISCTTGTSNYCVKVLP